MNNNTATSANEDPFPVSSAQKIDYAANYKKLAEIVEKLKRGGPGDIDGLVETFRAGIAAYEVCKGRLDAIRTEINSEIARLTPNSEAA